MCNFVFLDPTRGRKNYVHVFARLSSLYTYTRCAIQFTHNHTKVPFSRTRMQFLNCVRKMYPRVFATHDLAARTSEMYYINMYMYVCAYMPQGGEGLDMWLVSPMNLYSKIETMTYIYTYIHVRTCIYMTSLVLVWSHF